jgi:hypothetical protein
MILNAYAVLDFSLSLLRLILALLCVVLGLLAWLRARQPLIVEQRKMIEDRSYLLVLLAALLLTLNVVAWPLLYLLLQSYVPEWPGTMCIYGVTRIGAGSMGASRFLPALLEGLQLAKPLLVFGSGAWLTLYLINRRTQTAPLLKRVLLAMVLLGFVAAIDAAGEMTYLLIPKKEEFLSRGCCTAVFDDPAQGVYLAPEAVRGVDDRPRLTAAYYAVNGVTILGLLGGLVLGRRGRLPPLSAITLAALVALPVSGAFLVEVAAPILLHLPYHHCFYDLIPRAPEVVLSVALFLGGTCAVGWAAVAGWWGQSAESGPFLPGFVANVLFLALFCYLGSIVMMTIELALASS